MSLNPVKVAIIYYSATGTVRALARAAEQGAASAGALTRLRRVAELAPAEAIASNPVWQANAQEEAKVEEATLDDLAWADAVLFGTPTRYGTIASQLKQFIDTTGPLWMEGRLADKVYGGFTASSTAHGGQESTLLALSHVFHHWGGVMVPPGYTDPIQFATGNPYGASSVGREGEPPSETDLQAAAFQARRTTELAAQLKAGRVLANGAALDLGAGLTKL